MSSLWWPLNGHLGLSREKRFWKSGNITLARVYRVYIYRELSLATEPRDTKEGIEVDWKSTKRRCEKESQKDLWPHVWWHREGLDNASRLKKSPGNMNQKKGANSRSWEKEMLWDWELVLREQSLPEWESLMEASSREACGWPWPSFLVEDKWESVGGGVGRVSETGDQRIQSNIREECQRVSCVMILTTKGETSQPSGKNCNMMYFRSPYTSWDWREIVWTCLLRRLDLVRVDNRAESWVWCRCSRLLLSYQRAGGKTGQGEQS